MARHYEYQNLNLCYKPNWVQESILYIRNEEAKILKERTMVKG